MGKTVDDLRNEIRVAVGRYERRVSSAFTKEALAAICAHVGYEIDQNNFPPKPVMRAGILWCIGERADDSPEGLDRSFRKAELQAIADTLADE